MAIKQIAKEWMSVALFVTPMQKATQKEFFKKTASIKKILCSG